MSGLAPWALPPSRCRIVGVHAADPDRGSDFKPALALARGRHPECMARKTLMR